MTYNYRGKTITLDDVLVARYKRAWLGMEPDSVLFDSYVSIKYGDAPDSVLDNISEAELNELITHYMVEDIHINS